MLKLLLWTCLLLLPFSPLLAQLTINNKSLPPGSLNSIYSAQLVSDGVQPWQWSIAPGSEGLPPGISLSSTGVIGGTPSAPGVYSFTVTVRDGTGATGQQPLSITIPAITVTTLYLPVSQVFIPYSVQLTATGGSGGPYQWSYYRHGSPTHPLGPFSAFSGTEAGLITGTPGVSDIQYENEDFEVVVFDPVTQQQSLPTSLGIFVTPCAAGVSPLTLPDAEVGVNYSNTLSLSITQPTAIPEQCLSSGYTPTSISILPTSDLPAGITFSYSNAKFAGAALIPGTYRMAGFVHLTGPTYPIDYVADANFPISLTVLPPPSITTAPALPAGIVGEPYGPLQLAFSGGAPPYSLSFNGLLPQGISLDGRGVLRGTPTATGTFSFNVGLTDSLGGKSQPFPQAFQLTVTSSTPQLQVLRSSVTFAAPAGGDAPPPQTIDVTPAEGAAIPDNFQILVDVGQTNTPAPHWLTISAATASAPTRLVASVNQSNLAPGNYSARIQTIDSNGIHTAIPVALDVTSVSPSLAASPAMLSFAARADSPGTLVQNVLLNNAGGGGSLSFTASVAGASAWISEVTPASGQTTPNAPLFVQVRVSTQGLKTGSYHDSIQIASSAGNVTIPVSLFVAGSGSILSLNSNAALFDAASGQASSLVRDVEVLNIGDPNTAVNWSTSLLTGSTWLSLKSASGTATAATPAHYPSPHAWRYAACAWVVLRFRRDFRPEFIELHSVRHGDIEFGRQFHCLASGYRARRVILYRNRGRSSPACATGPTERQQSIWSSSSHVYRRQRPVARCESFVGCALCVGESSRTCGGHLLRHCDHLCRHRAALSERHVHRAA